MGLDWSSELFGNKLCTMIYRAATAEDVPQVQLLVKKICTLHQSWDAKRFGYKPCPEEIYRDWLVDRANDERSPFFVAERDGRLVAYLVGSIEVEIPIYWITECGWIHDLWVDEEYRHEGIARQLLMLSVEVFKKAGASQVRLQTAEANDVGRQFFSSLGFRVCTREMLLEL